MKAPWGRGHPLTGQRLYGALPDTAVIRKPDSGEVLPDVVERLEDVLQPEQLPCFGRSRLMLKARTSEEKLFYTTDDE